MAEPNAAENRAQAAIARRLAEAGFALPGSLLERTMVCGKPGCCCVGDPPRLHGPYHQWTREIDGKTVRRHLDAEQMGRYGPWLANARRIRELLAELEELSLKVAERGALLPERRPRGRTLSARAIKVLGPLTEAQLQVPSLSRAMVRALTCGQEAVAPILLGFHATMREALAFAIAEEAPTQADWDGRGPRASVVRRSRGVGIEHQPAPYIDAAIGRALALIECSARAEAMR
jgi:hypothetical protein